MNNQYGPKHEQSECKSHPTPAAISAATVLMVKPRHLVTAVGAAMWRVEIRCQSRFASEFATQEAMVEISSVEVARVTR